MDKLPPELLQLVISDKGLSNADRERLRLVNKKLSAAVAPIHFHTISVWISLTSLQRLTNIAEHENLSSYVKEIIFSPLRVKRIRKFNRHLARVTKWMSYSHTSLAPLFLSVVKYRTAWKNYIDTQDRLASESSDAAILIWALTKFAQLETCKFDLANECIGSRELIKAFGAFKAHGLLRYDCDYSFPLLIKALSESNTRIQVFEIDVYERRSRGTIDLPHAAYKSHPPSYPDTRFAYAFAKSFGFGDDKTRTAAFSQLRSFVMDSLAIDGGVAMNASQIDVSFNSLLSSAPLLEKVTIGEISPCSRTEAMPKLKSTFPSTTMRFLRQLQIYFFNTIEEHVLGLLTGHSQTLEDIFFSRVLLEKGDWSSMLGQARDSDWPHLKFFRLEDCETYFTPVIEVAPYLKRVTDMDPIGEAFFEMVREDQEEAEER